MPSIRLLLSILLVALAGLLLATPALASTKCQCENGAVIHAMDDGPNACEDACESFGGGREWEPEDADQDDDEVVDVERHPAPRVRSSATRR